MDTIREIPYQSQTTKEKNRSSSLQYGLFAGLTMGVIIALINLATHHQVHTALSLSKYAILGVIIGVALYRYKKEIPQGQIFKRGIRHGAIITFYSAIMLVLMNTLINSLGVPDLITERFLLTADNLPNLFTINGVLFFECLVLGMIWTFIWLQVFKDPKPAK